MLVDAAEVDVLGVERLVFLPLGGTQILLSNGPTIGGRVGDAYGSSDRSKLATLRRLWLIPTLATNASRPRVGLEEG